jgi:hypothetical protein
VDIRLGNEGWMWEDGGLRRHAVERINGKG